MHCARYSKILEVITKVNKEKERIFNDQDEIINKYDTIATPIKKRSSFGLKPIIPELSGGQILDSFDSDLNILAATQQQKNLLDKIGLTIENDSEVKIVKDKKGNLKSALSINKDKNTGNIKNIHYVDVDKDDKHFKKAIVKLATLPNGYSLQKEKVDFIKENINPNVIKEEE